MHQTRLLQHSGISSAQVGGLRGSEQHEELRDDAANPGSSIGVTTVAAGSIRAGRVGGIRRGDATGGILGSRILAEEPVLGLPGHLEEALNDLDRGIGTSNRELEGLLLRHQPITQGNEALQLPAALLRCLLRPQDEGEGEARPLGLGLLSSAMRFSSAPSLA